MSRPAPIIQLTPEEQKRLLGLANASLTPQAIARRVRIILLAAEGRCNKEISKRVGMSEQRVGLWRRRYLKHRLQGLQDAPRPGVPRKYDEKAVGEMIAMTLKKPEGITHWSVREMAKATGMSKSTVHRIWKQHDLQPHRVKSFKYSNDPKLAEKVVDIVGLYLNPPEDALVLSVDEKSQIQALDRTRPLLPLKPGQPERRTHDYLRHGTTTLFAALDVAEGKVMGECYNRHRHQEFLRFLNQINHNVPEDKEVHLIVDNYSTHKHEKVKKWMSRHPRFKFHFTPTSASWLNQVEIWFSILSAKQIRRGVFHSVKELIQKIKSFIHRHNQNARPFVWTKPPEEILAKASPNN